MQPLPHFGVDVDQFVNAGPLLPLDSLRQPLHVLRPALLNVKFVAAPVALLHQLVVALVLLQHFHQNALRLFLALPLPLH